MWTRGADDAISSNKRAAALGYEQVVIKHRNAISAEIGKRALARHFRKTALRWFRAKDAKRAFRLAPGYLWSAVTSPNAMFQELGAIGRLAKDRFKLSR